MISIFIADDHSLIRDGIRGLLELEDDFTVVGEASDGSETVEKVKQTKPDVLLLDLNMPSMSGLETLERIRSTNKKVKILVLTIHDEVQYIRKAFSLGANGYILKDSDFNTLQIAIHEVFEDGKFIDKKLSSVYSEKINVVDSAEEQPITRREREILILVAKGYINREIAIKLSISEKTVKNHVSNLFKKIKVNDRTQAAVYAIKNGYIEI